MPRPDGRRVILAVLAVTGILLAAQLVLGRTLLGGAGVAVLIVPPVVLIELLGRGVRRSGPERVLAAIAFALAVTVLGSVLAALAPRGLDPASVAFVELIVLGVAAARWLARAPGTPASDRTSSRLGREHAHRALPASGPASAAGSASVATRVSTAWRRSVPASLLAGVSGLLVVIGIVLGAAGFAIAARAAQVHDATGYLLFWSAPDVPGQGTHLGIRNGYAEQVACTLTVTRPGLPSGSVDVGTVEAGTTWQGLLGPSPTSARARWQLALTCSLAGEPLERVLLIEPPR